MTQRTQDQQTNCGRIAKLALPALGAIATLLLSPSAEADSRFSASARVHAEVNVGGVVAAAIAGGVGVAVDFGPPRCFRRPCGTVVVAAPPPPPPPPMIVAAPAPVVVVPHRPLQIGAFVGSGDVEGNGESSDVGLMMRYSLSPHWALEGELSQSQGQYQDSAQGRAGIGLAYQFGPSRKLSPYLVGALGAKESLLGEGIRAYAEAGLGLRLGLGSRFSLLGDIRVGRQEHDTDVLAFAPGPSTVSEPEDQGFARLRLGAMVSF